MLSVSGVLIVAAAILVSNNVSDHLQTTAVAEAVRTTEAVVRGYVDPLVTSEVLADPTSPAGVGLDADLQRLVSTGKILRIKIWGEDGTVVFSDLPALRGRQFPVEDDLADVFTGEVSTEFSDGTDAENVFEHGLADRFLSIYLPIRAADGGQVIGAYEVYEDAAPIVADIAQTRQDVLLIVGGMALGILALLYAAFSVASRRLTKQNRRLVEQAIKEQILTTDLRRNQERFRSLVQNSVDVNMIVATDGTIEYESPAVERVLGFKADDRIGRSAFAAIHPDDVGWGEELLGDVVRTPGAMVAGEFRVKHADGSWRWIEAVGKNLLDDPAVGGVVVNYRDITSRKELEDELRHQAFHDSLTGLANRALFVDRLEHALSLSQRAPRPVAVLFVDLDDFKTINDSLGHGEGDVILQRVAERLRGALRDGDTLARMGGDEFAVLVEDPPAATAPTSGRRTAGRCPPGTVQGGRQGAVRPRQRRGCRADIAPPDRRRAVAQRGHLDVHGQAEGQEPHRDLRTEHARGRAGPARPQGRPRAGPRTRRILRALSAGDEPGVARDRRRRSAPALAPSGARRRPPGRSSSRSPRRPG